MLLRPSQAWDLRRFGVLALAVLHLGAVTALPGADATLDARQANAPVHVESPGNDDCPTHHDHLFCQVVRSLSAAENTARVGRLADAGPTVAWLRPPAADAQPSGLSLFSGPVGPRAPPQA